MSVETEPPSLVDLIQQIQQLEATLAQHQATIEAQKSIISDQAFRCENLRKSLSFRLGWFLTTPLRWAYEAFFSNGKQEINSNQKPGDKSPPSPSSLLDLPFEPVDWQVEFPPLPSDSHEKTIFIYMPFMAVGGAEHLAFHIMKSLPEVRWVVLTSLQEDGSIGSTEDMFRTVTPYVYNAGKHLKQEHHFSFITYLIDHFEPAVFYISNGSSFVYEVLPSLKIRYPFLTIADQVYDHKAGWINQYSPQLAQHIDISIGANHHICRAYVEKGASLKRVHLIEHCIDTSAFDPKAYSIEEIKALKQKLGLPTDKKIIAFIGRLHPQKRPVDFLELVRQFENNKDVFFLMLGDGPLSETIDKQMERLHLKNIVKQSFYKPAADIFALIDLLVLPSKYEGMPLVIMEAQAMGKAVVATDVGNNKDFLSYTEGGFIVPEIGDVKGLKMAVEKALVNPIDAQAIRKRVVDRVDCKIVAQQYFDVFFEKKGKKNA